ncbi:MAG: hypothetical protein VXY58_00120 [Bacteroidota bacterium]|nr:hypothetical protein [Bacteroidota bacterium]
MMYWNVTYNDPNRWKAVYEASGGRLPWWRGVRETFAGLPVGSPKLDLVRVEGITELQELRKDLSERTAINFSRTAAGLIAFTKVRLEVYAVPMRWSEQLICSQEGALVVQFQRGAESVRLHMRGSASAEANFRAWFARAAQ